MVSVTPHISNVRHWMGALLKDDSLQVRYGTARHARLPTPMPTPMPSEAGVNKASWAGLDRAGTGQRQDSAGFVSTLALPRSAHSRSLACRSRCRR